MLTCALRVGQIQPVDFRERAIPGPMLPTKERIELCSKVGLWLIAGYILGPEKKQRRSLYFKAKNLQGS